MHRYDPTGTGSSARGFAARFQEALRVVRYRAGEGGRRDAGADQRDRPLPPRHHGRDRAASGLILRHRCPKLDKPSGSLRTRTRGTGQGQRIARHPPARIGVSANLPSLLGLRSAGRHMRGYVRGVRPKVGRIPNCGEPRSPFMDGHLCAPIAPDQAAKAVRALASSIRRCGEAHDRKSADKSIADTMSKWLAATRHPPSNDLCCCRHRPALVEFLRQSRPNDGVNATRTCPYGKIQYHQWTLATVSDTNVILFSLREYLPFCAAR